MERVDIAYLLIALMLAGAVVGIAHFWYHIPERTYLRRRKRENAEYARRMKEKESPPGL